MYNYLYFIKLICLRDLAVVLVVMWQSGNYRPWGSKSGRIKGFLFVSTGRERHLCSKQTFCHASVMAVKMNLFFFKVFIHICFYLTRDRSYNIVLVSICIVANWFHHFCPVWSPRKRYSVQCTLRIIVFCEHMTTSNTEASSLPAFACNKTLNSPRSYGKSGTKMRRLHVYVFCGMVTLLCI